ncbi:uncharacterized protein LOC143291396 [Babylonia areolata]|uniref:uncharacterized protein LOC143291396 n=1 Tax=Babylonia areolata TaxID=304850 RepID=UPI003FCF737B
MNGTTDTDPSHGDDFHVPYWELGSGHFGNMIGQQARQAVQSCFDPLSTFTGSNTQPSSAALSLPLDLALDYGTSDGYSSMPLVSSVIHKTSYLSQYRNVYTFATHFGFYKQCVPDAACDVIYSSTAVHALEKLPLRLKNCVFEIFATDQERTRFHAQGAQDWTKFLTLRAKELKPGGLLVILTMSSRPKRGAGQGKSTPDDCDRGREEPIIGQIDVYADLEDAWKQLRDDKTITQEEYEEATFKVIFRSAQEMKSPFETDGSAVVQSGLRLVEYKEFAVPCVFKAGWFQDQSTATAAAQADATFARSLVAAHRVWSQSSFHHSLSDMRSEAEKTAIMEDLYERCRRLVLTKDPQSYRSETLMARLVIRKV